MFILYLHIHRSKLSSDNCYDSGCTLATEQDGWWGGKRMFRGSKEQAEIVLSFEGGYVSLSKFTQLPSLNLLVYFIFSIPNPVVPISPTSRPAKAHSTLHTPLALALALKTTVPAAGAQELA
jgi:hypothetical protein